MNIEQTKYLLPEESHVDRELWNDALKYYAANQTGQKERKVSDWNNFYTLLTCSKDVEPDDSKFCRSIDRVCKTIGDIQTIKNGHQDIKLNETKKFLSRKIKEQIAESGYFSSRPQVIKTLQENPLAAVLANAAIIVNNKAINNFANLLKRKYSSVRNIYSEILSPEEVAYNVILSKVENPEKDNFLTGFYNSYRNHLIDSIRKAKRGNKVFEADYESELPIIERVEGGVKSGDFFNADMVTLLKKEVGRLTGNQRSIALFMIGHIENNGEVPKYEEISKNLSINIGTVKGVIFQIRRKLSENAEILEEFPSVKR